MTRPGGTGEQVHVVTLGCSKNTVDSEVLLRQLRAAGFRTTHNDRDAGNGVVVINTCGFILDARQESIDTILRFAGARRRGEISKLLVVGCLSRRYGNELRREIPEVDAFFGVEQYREILGMLGGRFRKELLGERILSAPTHYAYLKISEGCDRGCAFCTIPLIRGRHRSGRIGDLVRESLHLADQGAKELILIAQDLSSYGLDLYREQKLPQLLEKLAATGRFEWIRLHYLYPNRFPAGILDLMATTPALCRYIDIPLQHISGRVLKKMRRGSDATEARKVVEIIRKKVEGVHLRTTLMVGHPGETEKDFAELLEYVKETRFERLGAFTYSHEEDTYGYRNYRDSIPEKVKQERLDELMGLQEDISGQLNQQKVNTVMRVLVDRREGEYYLARSEYDSPEVDNEVLIQGEKVLEAGEFTTVRITGSGPYELIGVPAGLNIRHEGDMKGSARKNNPSGRAG